MIVRPTRRRTTAHRPGRIIATLNDHNGRPIAHIYASTSHGAPAYRFRVLGGNGEIMPDAYTTITDAKRGVGDLADRMSGTGERWENAE